MKAAVVRSFDHPPRFEDFDLPAPEPGQVVLEVLASAIHPRVRSGANGSHYTSRGTLPMVPGIDGVGKLPNGQLVYFLGAHEAVGTLAEYAVAHTRHCIPLVPGAAPVATAAAMIAAISSWVALTARVQLQPGQRVLVLGATGTAGRLAVQIAKKLGAGQVVAAGRGGAALESLRASGADVVVPLDPAASADGGGDGGGGGGGGARALAQAASEVHVVLDYLWGDVTQAALPAILKMRQDEDSALRWIEIGSLAGDSVAVSSVFLRKRNLHLLGSGQGSASMAEMLACVPAIMAGLAHKELTVDAQEAPLSQIETLWNAPTAAGQRLVFVR